MFRVRENLYATQFHPELDLAGIVTRIGVYRDYGYYRPGEYDEVVARVRAADVWAPPLILEAFVRRYAHATDARNRPESVAPRSVRRPSCTAQRADRKLGESSEIASPDS